MRDISGEPQHVELTLQGTGMFTIAGDYAAALLARQQPPRISRTSPVNPIWNSYQCADGRWILLVNPVPFPAAWPAFCRLAGREEWLGEQYGDVLTLRAASPSLTSEVEAIVASKPLDEWGRLLDDAGLIWAPVATMPEMVSDPQVREMGWFTEIEGPDGPFETLDTPFKIYGTDTGARGPAPAAGQHTLEVLAELGVSDAEVDRLAANGVIG
jgi:crotonobetainyl-CoA:carnitine CoA-transferase CaiB-like acyl-CoA transferase